MTRGDKKERKKETTASTRAHLPPHSMPRARAPSRSSRSSRSSLREDRDSAVAPPGCCSALRLRLRLLDRPPSLSMRLREALCPALAAGGRCNASAVGAGRLRCGARIGAPPRSAFAASKAARMRQRGSSPSRRTTGPAAPPRWAAYHGLVFMSPSLSPLPGAGRPAPFPVPCRPTPSSSTPRGAGGALAAGGREAPKGLALAVARVRRASNNAPASASTAFDAACSSPAACSASSRCTRCRLSGFHTCQLFLGSRWRAIAGV
jgi:hypothetical protein